MADAKISALTATTTVADDDMYPVATAAGATKKITGASLKAAVAPVAATYLVQTASSGLSAEQAMGALATGIVKNTTTSGVQSIAALGTDYYGPTGTDVAVADGGTGASTAAAARSNLGVAIELISSVPALGGTAASHDFTSIPGTYSHLRLVWVGATDNAGAQFVIMRFNNDSSGVDGSSGTYFWQTLVSNAATLAAAEGLTKTSMAIGAVPPSTATALPGSYVIDIPWYAGTTFHKAAVSHGSYYLAATTTNQKNDSYVGRWANTAAITRVTLLPGAGNWIAGSACNLYGIL